MRNGAAISCRLTFEHSMVLIHGLIHRRIHPSLYQSRPYRMVKPTIDISRCLCSKPNALLYSALRPSSAIRSTRCRPRYHAYSTRDPFSLPQRKPNYKIAIFCGLAGVAATLAVARPKPQHLDAPPNPGRDALPAGAKVEVTGKDHGDDADNVATETSTVPYFPRSIWLPRSRALATDGISPAIPAGIGAAREEEEYHLLGLGIRKVSLFRIQVYVVGLYVANGDLGKLQEELVKASVGGGASTLVQGEKEELRKTLLDGEGSTKLWAQVLKEGGVRSAVRVVPTRNTNFSHLRDGWVRGIDSRSKGKEFEDESFQVAVGEFKGMFGGKGSVGKGKVLLLGRGADGALRVWVEEETTSPGASEHKVPLSKAGKMNLLGDLKDERISRLVWMGYLAGDNIASEEARRNVVEGIIEIVERPFGTVETQVV